MLSTSGEFVEVLNFREDNEESSEETTGCKVSVYAEFDECTRSENFIEILRFRHFTRYMSFTPTDKQGKKNRKDACFQNFWKMSVLFFYSNIEKCTDSRFLGVFGEKTVNVLKVNLMLDGIL